jgi:hypothetical protein
MRRGITEAAMSYTPCWVLPLWGFVWMRVWEEYLVVIFMAEPAERRLGFLQTLYNNLAERIQASPDWYTEFLSEDATVLDVWWAAVRAATRILFIQIIFDSWDLTHM